MVMPPIIPSSADALAWADRLYRPLAKDSGESTVRNYEEALERYRAVSRRYPNELRAHRGAARCLFRLGKYGEAVREYRASQCAPDELATAIDFAGTAARIQKGLPDAKRVQFLVRRSRTRWVALTARVTAQDGFDVTLTQLDLRSFRASPQGIAPAWSSRSYSLSPRLLRGDLRLCAAFPGQLLLCPNLLSGRLGLSERRLHRGSVAPSLGGKTAPEKPLRHPHPARSRRSLDRGDAHAENAVGRRLSLPERTDFLRPFSPSGPNLAVL